MSTDLDLLQARADMHTATTPWKLAEAAEQLADAFSSVDSEFTFSVFDKFWRKTGELGDDLITGSGTDPRNNVPSATLKMKGSSAFVETMMGCRDTLVGITVETAGLRFAHYVDTHDYEYDNGALTSTANCPGIWDILSYMTIWPSWFLPVQFQPISHAVFIGPIVTVIENMISECALRIQSGINEFLNNALSLNPDFRSWIGTLLLNNGNIGHALKTPMYVVRTNPLLDGSPLVARTVRMESCATVITDLTRAYGVDVRVDLWLPGDAQPDPWANLDQPTYVVTVKDRSQIEGPTKTILDSVIRTVVDLQGSLLGNALQPLLNPQGQYAPEGVYIAPALGVNFVKPYAILEVPEPGEVSSILKCKISDHTPKGWRHVIGGKSPKWLVCAPRVTGGRRPTAYLKRPHQRHAVVADRFDHDRDRIYGCAVKSIGRLHERRDHGVSAHRSLRPPQRRRSVSPSDGTVYRNGIRAVQHRGAVHIYQRSVG